MKIKHSLIFLFFLISFTQVNAQAFDGDMDSKIFIGYLQITDIPGIEIKYEQGKSDYWSGGMNASYLFTREPQYEDPFYQPDDTWTFVKRFNLSIFTNFHFVEVFNMGTQLDPYIGLHVGLRSTGMQGGLRYNFSEILGVYAQYSYNVFPLIMEELSIEVDEYPYRNPTHLSIGVTLNLN